MIRWISCGFFCAALWNQLKTFLRTASLPRISREEWLPAIFVPAHSPHTVSSWPGMDLEAQTRAIKSDRSLALVWNKPVPARWASFELLAHYVIASNRFPDFTSIPCLRSQSFAAV